LLRIDPDARHLDEDRPEHDPLKLVETTSSSDGSGTGTTHANPALLTDIHSWAALIR
jgi:hypothetical protein